MITTLAVQSNCIQNLSSRRNLCILAELQQQQQQQQQQRGELRVCTNRTCRRQGSYQILETLTGLAPPNLTVKPCGCLGRCGAGPNVALHPQGAVISHLGTNSKAAQLVVAMYSDGDDEAVRKCLDSLALRKRAVVEIEQGRFAQAETLLSQAVELNPYGGVHIACKCRSIAQLGMGNYTAALEDAREALKLAPHDPEAYMCEGDVFMAMKLYDAAEKSYSMCLQMDPSKRRSKSFKARVSKLQEKLVDANVP